QISPCCVKRLVYICVVRAPDRLSRFTPSGQRPLWPASRRDHKPQSQISPVRPAPLPDAEQDDPP
ncbi:hypothetical protein NXW13_00735, partial [Bacteroides thetaiotaomicron]|nr:hypothetical protein [Bacteroides thetaiotaomicron]